MLYLNKRVEFDHFVYLRLFEITGEFFLVAYIFQIATMNINNTKI